MIYSICDFSLIIIKKDEENVKSKKKLKQRIEQKEEVKGNVSIVGSGSYGMFVRSLCI